MKLPCAVVLLFLSLMASAKGQQDYAYEQVQQYGYERPDYYGYEQQLEGKFIIIARIDVHVLSTHCIVVGS